MPLQIKASILDSVVCADRLESAVQNDRQRVAAYVVHNLNVRLMAKQELNNDWISQRHGKWLWKWRYGDGG
jgi:hypothetical protein